MRLRVRQENNIAHRIHKIHRMSSSAWSESETNRNSVCSVLSVCKQIRADTRDTLEINNQRDFTDSHAERLNVSTDHEDHEENPCNHVDNKIFCAFRAFCVQKKSRADYRDTWRQKFIDDIVFSNYPITPYPGF